ncbi:hypothetical protein [Microbulbifer epialgicus]|uniref:Flagellar biosynthesis protein, FliO n=1 Tax=Microbulbifer epialgicus TaxID=393907 RepID=A0ABV4NZ03_9GAMM
MSRSLRQFVLFFLLMFLSLAVSSDEKASFSSGQIVNSQDSVFFKEDFSYVDLLPNNYFFTIFLLAGFFVFLKIYDNKRRQISSGSKNIRLIEKTVLDNKLVAYLLVVDGNKALLIQQPSGVDIALLSGQDVLEVDRAA